MNAAQLRRSWRGLTDCQGWMVLHAGPVPTGRELDCARIWCHLARGHPGPHVHDGITWEAE